LGVFLAEEVKDYYLLHAGAVARDGAGIVLPGPPESGKSSLTTALLLQGCQYLSDELSVVDASTGYLYAFPKPLSLKDPSLFPDLGDRKGVWFGPELGASTKAMGRIGSFQPVWYVHPEDVRSDSIGGPVPIRFVVFPKYAPGVMPELQPLPPGQAVRELLNNSVNFRRFGSDGLHLLARLAEQAQCFSLPIDGLEAPVRLVTELAGN